MNVRPERESGVEAESARRAGMNVQTEAEADAQWYPIYAAVVIYTVLLIGALWGFARLYSP